jgi:TolB-like protein/Flp pilus assembly protein TadD
LLAAALALSGWGAALYFSLRSQPAQPTPASVKTIAVLPFKPLGQSEDDQLLGLGMADALITRLGNVGPVVVRPTSAVRKYTSLDQDPAAVGRELKVESVLEGSVQRAGDRVRVTVQLVGVQGGAPLWSGKFDEQFTDIFAVQDAISEHVAEALTLQLTGEERGRLNKRYTENTEAYVLYLKGRYYWNKRTREGTTKSLEFYDRAISLDPNFALAYAGLADSYYGLSDQYLPPQEVMPKARAAAQKALEIDNDLAEAHVSLGVVLMYYDWDWAGAEKEFTQAVRLNPRYALAHHHYKSFLMRMGRQEEAAREAALAHELDPTSLVIAANLGLPYYYGRDYDKALDYFRAASDMDPNFYFAHLFQGWAYEQKGQFAEAVQEFETCRRLDDSPIIIGSLAHAYAVSGRRAEARALLSELQRTESGRFVDPYYLAVVYAGLGEREQAFEQLDRAYRARDETLTWLKIDPRLDPLRADPRFADLLQSLRL